ncbi:MAG: phosphatase PAP2 family protein [Polyangiaceae bacterium]
MNSSLHRHQHAILLGAALAAFAPCERAAAQAKDEHRLHWDESHPRVVWGEYTLTALSITGAGIIEFGTEQPIEPRWIGPILFDEIARDAVAMPRLKDRRGIQIASDVLLAVSAAYPVLIDGVLVPAIDENLDMLQQLTAMNLEAYGIAYLVMRVNHRLAARERPAGIGCQTDKGWAYDCGSFGVNASWFSGHATMSAVGAGLTCAHHAYVPLYGGGAPDVVACVGSTALAVTIAGMRVISDRHWMSDAISGFLFGYGVGLAVPLALHYTQTVDGPNTSAAASAPLVTARPPVQLSWGGQF